MVRRPLSDDVLIKLRTKMIRHATISNNPFPDDIANQYVINLLSGLHQHATISQAYVDILRTSSGRKSSEHYDTRMSLNSGTSEVLDFLKEDYTENLHDRLCVEKLIKLVSSQKLKKIFKFKLQGYTNLEIAEYFKVTEGRISQLILCEHARLRKVLKISDTP